MIGLILVTKVLKGILFGMVMLSSMQFPTTTVSIFKPWVEPVEVAYFIPYDLKIVIKATSNSSRYIYFLPSTIKMLEDKGYEIKDIWIVIHNHLTPGGFSKQDIQYYWMLVNNGFIGRYMLKNPRGVFVYTGSLVVLPVSFDLKGY